ncbi:MAG: Ig-like domain-containing protein [Planctomycetes bacterium]|nr:Ig-like domain-containing protein [Planctomycetota bacterium]
MPDPAVESQAGALTRPRRLGTLTRAGVALCALTLAACGGTRTPPVPPPPADHAITAVIPDQGSVAGGSGVTIRGSQFAPSMRVFFGEAEASSVTFQSPSALVAVTPASAAGPADLRVVASDNRTALRQGGFVFLDPITVVGTVSAGPVSGGVASLHGLDNDGRRHEPPLAVVTTDARGGFRADIGVHTGPFLVEVSGGVYAEESGAGVVTLAASTPLRMLHPGATASLSGVAVTPLTTIAAARALAQAAGGTQAIALLIDNANRQVGERFAVGAIATAPPVDFTVAPASPPDPKRDDVKAGAINAGLSQTAKTLGVSSLDLTATLAADLAADGAFDGLGAGGAPVTTGPAGAPVLVPANTSTTALAAGVNAFLAGGHNLSGLTPASLAVTVTAISTAPASLEVAPAVTGVAPSTASHAGGATLAVTGAGFTEETSVSVGGRPALVKTRNLAAQPQTLTVTLPAGDVGPADVAARNASPALAGSLVGAFAYVDPSLAGAPPVVTLLYPDGGETLPGGGSVAIRWMTDSAEKDKVSIAFITGGAGAGAVATDVVTEVGDGGAFVWSVPPIDNGAVRVRVTARDKSGRSGADDSNAAFIIDSTPPAAPTGLSPAAASDTGASATDRLTADDTPTVEGVAEAGATVRVLASGAVVGIGVTGADGRFAITTEPLPEGGVTLMARAADRAGNLSGFSEPLALVIDKTAPAAPTTLALSPASDTGSSAADGVTRVATPTFTGVCEPGAMVSLRAGGAILAEATPTTAGFTIATSPLADGAYQVVAVASDLAGNPSALSNAVAVTVDATAPPQPAGLTLDPADDTGLSNGDGVTSLATLRVTGTAEPGAAVTLTNGQGELGSGAADATGEFAITTSALTEKTHFIVASASDLAGNTSALSSNVRVTVDQTAPTTPAPTISLAPAADSGASNSDRVTNLSALSLEGTAEAGALVEVLETTALRGVATAGADNAWTVTLGALVDGAHAFKLRVTDAAGNSVTTSDAPSVTIDTVAPAAPTGLALATASDTGASASDGLTKLASPLLTGAAENDATITAREGSVALGSAVASAGAFSITPTSPLAEGAHTLTVVATDPAGNASGASLPVTLTVDLTAPAVASVAGSIVAGAQNDFITVVFGEAVDPATATVAANYAVENPAGAPVTLTGSSVVYSAATRAATITLHAPGAPDLTAGGLRVTAANVADLAGNPVAAGAARDGTVSALDKGKPFVVTSIPAEGAGGPVNQRWVVTLSEALDPTTVTTGTVGTESVQFFPSGQPLRAGTVTLSHGDRYLTFAPAANMTTGTTFVLALDPSITDPAGNRLKAPDLLGANPAKLLTVVPDAPADLTAPTVTSVSPANGAASAPVDTPITVTFSRAVDPATVSATSIEVSTGGAPIAGAAFTFNTALTTVTCQPAAPLEAGKTYALAVKAAVRDLYGNGCAPSTTTFTTSSADVTPPVISLLTVNAIPAILNGAGSAGGTMLTPASGFSIDVAWSDLGGSGISTTALTVSANVALGGGAGAGGADAGQNVGGQFTVTQTGATWSVPANLAFPTGAVTVTARIADVAGNLSAAATYSFLTEAITDAVRPFEAENLWFVDFTRDAFAISIAAGAGTTVNFSSSGGANGVADFTEELRVHGLNVVSGAPVVPNTSGQDSNAWMRQRVIDRIIARTYDLYGIASSGGVPTYGPDSVRLRLTTTAPSPSDWSQSLGQRAYNYDATPYSQISVGGYAGSGISGLSFINENNNRQDNDSLATPLGGVATLGIFPAADFAFDVNGSASSLFRETFDPLIPLANRGNAPVGSGADDATVLDPQFVPAAGTPAQQARHTLIENAIEVFALNTAMVLAHEIGHSLGLMVGDGPADPRPPPLGLFGGDSANFPGSTPGHVDLTTFLPPGVSNVMSPSQTLDERVNTDTKFCALALAYLRERALYHKP